MGGTPMIAVIEHTPAGPALLVHGVRVAEKSVGDTTLQALADQINAAAGWRPIETASRDGTKLFSIGARMAHPITASCSDRWSEGDWIRDGMVFWTPTWRRCSIATHWMPMPEPPDDM